MIFIVIDTYKYNKNNFTMKLNKTITTVLLIIASIFATFEITKRFFPTTEYVEVAGKPVQVDENVWVLRNVYNSRGMILDSLKIVNANLYKQIQRDKNQIANLTQIIGSLRTEIDGLKDGDDSLIVIGGFELPDTSITFNRTFGDSLFAVKSTVVMKDSTIQNQLILSNIRPIRIDVVNTMSADKSRIYTYVSSTDFDSLSYTSVTSLKRDRLRWWQWGLVGFATGVVTVSLTN